MRKRSLRSPVAVSLHARAQGRAGFHDLTNGMEKTESSRKAKEFIPAVEKALFDFCHELAGIILKRLQEQRPADRICEQICREIEDSGKFPREQARSLFALALELIRATAMGSYRRDDRELSGLIGKALGAENPESLN